MPEAPKLVRAVSLPLLVVYGLGTMVGGGFYALLGRVAGEAGMHAPLSILVAGALALVSALAFAELGSRFPLAAGEAHYVERAFGRNWLSVVVGLLVIATGVVSAATLANAVVRFLQDQFVLDRNLGIVAVVVGFGLLTAWGIAEAVWIVLAITIVEVAGLLFVIAVGSRNLVALPEQLPEMVPALAAAPWGGVLLGAFTIFYAFIGFEDMVNLAEEVRQPERNLPRGILWALGLTIGLYFAVAVVAVLTVPPAELAESLTPMAAVVERAGIAAGPLMGAVSVLAGVNGALVQIIMAARVVYGMGDKGLAPAWLARVHSWTRTPVRATAVVTAVVLVLALWFPLETLAHATSTIILVVFTLVNLALWRVAGREPDRQGAGIRLPRTVPLVGAASSLAFVVYRLWRTVAG